MKRLNEAGVIYQCKIERYLYLFKTSFVFHFKLRLLEGQGNMQFSIKELNIYAKQLYKQVASIIHFYSLININTGYQLV